MPIVVVAPSSDAAIANWDDPFVKIYLQEIRVMIDRLQQPEGNQPERYRLAESLCDASRSLLYRIERVTADDCRELSAVFDSAATAVEKTGHSFTGREAGLLIGFSRNLRKRAEMLRRKLPAST